MIPQDTLFSKTLNYLIEKRSMLSQTFEHMKGKELVYKRDPKSDNIENVLKSLANNETGIVQGDKYAFRKFSGSPEMGDDIGKYQVTAGELKSYAKQFVGRSVTPDEYHSNPSLQEEYNRNKVSKLMDAGATVPEIFALHRGGLTGYNDPEVRKQKLEQRKDYAQKGMDFYQKLGNVQSN